MNVPKLRFKEFNDEWKITNINEQCEVFGRIGFRGYTTNDLVEKGQGAISLSPSNIKGTSLNTEKENTYISMFKYEESPEIKIYNNDIIFVKTGSSYGKVALIEGLNELATINPQLIVLKNIKCNNKVLCELLNDNRIQIQVEQTVVGGTIPTLSQAEFKKYKFYLPQENEQNKIGKLLKLLDKKIELQSKKIEDLKLFKKGLINVLNKKSYQETALGKIGKFQTSSIDKLVKENEKIVNLYNYMDVYKHKILMTQDLSKLSKTSAKDNQITINNLKRGDILFTPSSETPDDIGHSICIQEDLPNTVYSYHLLRYRPNIIMDPLFSNYYFNNSKIRKQIIRYATGATRYTISLDSFLKIKVNIPDLITQKKYGLLLYSTDKKVNKELLKLNKLQELKKGLMQNMFV